MLELLHELLLLSGDIEANPGPELAQIAKQLKEVVLDIGNIKEPQLTVIETKLDALSSLERQITARASSPP